MRTDEIKAVILKKIMELTNDELKEYIHSMNIEFSSDDKKITVEFNI